MPIDVMISYECVLKLTLINLKPFGLPLCLTSKVEHLNPTKSFAIGIIMSIPLLMGKFSPRYTLQPHQGQHLLYQWLNALGIPKV
jgi:hypothetical protein